MKRLFLIITGISILFGNVFSQVDPDQIIINSNLPTRVVMPMTMKKDLYGIEHMLLPALNNGFFDYYQVSGTAGFCETDIAAAPWNPNIFVASDNRVTGFVGTPWVYYTTDAGVTWGQASVNSNQGDPIFTADSSGNFYMAVLNNGVQVYKSSNNGQSWFVVSQVNSNSQTDKEWIAADPTNGPYKNHVYVAFVNFATGGNVDFYRSTNNGVTWEGTGIGLGTSSTNPGPNIVVGVDGRVVVAWANGAGTSVRVSTNGGATFGPIVIASAHTTPGTVHSSGRYVLKGDIRVNGNPNLAVDRTTGPRRGYIYNVYPSNPPGPDAADIFCTRSTDGGATWNVTGPVRINSDETFNDQWLPDVSVDRQGRIWAFWFDSREDAANNLTAVYAAVSTNGGDTWQDFRIAPAFNPTFVKINQGNHYYMGDYQGMAGESNVTFPFTYGPNNNRQNYIAYLPDFGVSFSKTIDSVNPGSTSVVRVRIPTFGPLYGTLNYSATISPSPAPGTATFTWSPSNVKVMNGNPDSLILSTTFNASVPLNLYTVTVTGTEQGGPRTHTRTFQIRVGSFVGVEKNGTEIANVFALEQNYPNPFNPETNIKFSLPTSSDVTIKVYDMLGNLIESIVNEKLEAGNYSTKFDGTKLSSGIYFYRIVAGSFADTKRMMLVK